MQAYRVTIIVAIVAVTCNQLVFTFLLCFACNPVRLLLYYVWVYANVCRLLGNGIQVSLDHV